MNLPIDFSKPFELFPEEINYDLESIDEFDELCAEDVNTNEDDSSE